MTKKSKKDAATSARQKSGARGLGVLEGKLARKKKGRVPGADLGTKRGVRAAAHKDIPTTTAEERKAAAGITAGMLLTKPAISAVGKALDYMDHVAGQSGGTYHDYFQGKTLPVRTRHSPSGRKYTYVEKGPRHTRKSKGSGKYAPIGDLDVEYLSMSKAPAKVSKNMISKAPAKVSKNVVSKAKDTKVSKNKLSKAKGGYIKKYANGGSVRAARF